MDSAHHQLTVHIHIGHLRSPVEQCQHHRKLPASATSTAQSSLHSAFTMPEALRTIRIRTNNTNCLPSEYVRITLFLFVTFNAFDAIKPPGSCVRDSIVLYPPRPNTKRIAFSYSYQCAIKATFHKCPLHPRCIVLLRFRSAQSHFPQVPSASTMHCSSPLQQRYQSRSPQAHSASSMHCSSPLQQRHLKSHFP